MASQSDERAAERHEAAVQAWQTQLKRAYEAEAALMPVLEVTLAEYKVCKDEIAWLAARLADAKAEAAAAAALRRSGQAAAE